MVAEGEGRVGAAENLLVPEMDAIEESDCQYHESALERGRTTEEKSLSSSSRSLSNGMASVTENFPILVRRRAWRQAGASLTSARTITPLEARSLSSSPFSSSR